MMNGLNVIFKRDIKNLFSNKILVYYNYLFPIILVLLFGLLSKNNYGKEVTSFDYYGIAMIIYAIMNVSLTASNTFMEKRWKSSNIRVLYAPINPSTVYLSKIFATFLFTSLSITFVILFNGLIFKVNYGGVKILLFLIYIYLLNLFSCSLGVMFCCIFKSEELSNKILSLIINIFAILGGIFFAIDGLGNAVRKISYASPVRWVLIGAFRMIYDNDLRLFLFSGTLLFFTSLIFMIVCKLTFKTEDYV